MSYAVRKLTGWLWIRHSPSALEDCYKDKKGKTIMPLSPPPPLSLENSQGDDDNNHHFIVLPKFYDVPCSAHFLLPHQLNTLLFLTANMPQAGHCKCIARNGPDGTSLSHSLPSFPPLEWSLLRTSARLTIIFNIRWPWMMLPLRVNGQML